MLHPKVRIKRLGFWCRPNRRRPQVGADLCMGSLIKNGGGTIVSGGGYVAGRADLVERAVGNFKGHGWAGAGVWFGGWLQCKDGCNHSMRPAAGFPRRGMRLIARPRLRPSAQPQVARLTAPGIGMDAGCVPGETLRLMFQGAALACSASFFCMGLAGRGGREGRGGRGDKRALGSPLPGHHGEGAPAALAAQPTDRPTPLPCPPSPCSALLAGLWLAPQMVGEALKGGRLAAAVLAKEGFNVIPAPGRSDPWSFITGAAVLLGCHGGCIWFCAQSLSQRQVPPCTHAAATAAGCALCSAATHLCLSPSCAEARPAGPCLLQRWSWAARSAWWPFAARCSSAAPLDPTSNRCQVSVPAAPRCARCACHAVPAGVTTRSQAACCYACAVLLHALRCRSLKQPAFSPSSTPPPLPTHSNAHNASRRDPRLRRRGDLRRRHLHRRQHRGAERGRPHPAAIRRLLPGGAGGCWGASWCRLKGLLRCRALSVAARCSRGCCAGCNSAAHAARPLALQNVQWLLPRRGCRAAPTGRTGRTCWSQRWRRCGPQTRARRSSAARNGQRAPGAPGFLPSIRPSVHFILTMNRFALVLLDSSKL